MDYKGRARAAVELSDSVVGAAVAASSSTRTARLACSKCFQLSKPISEYNSVQQSRVYASSQSM